MQPAEGLLTSGTMEPVKRAGVGGRGGLVVAGKATLEVFRLAQLPPAPRELAHNLGAHVAPVAGRHRRPRRPATQRPPMAGSSRVIHLE
eukprot:scaffold283729_cov33-Tisochrysis_lutea.AAC.3